jgi:hypothetical protein
LPLGLTPEPGTRHHRRALSPRIAGTKADAVYHKKVWDEPYAAVERRLAARRATGPLLDQSV